MFLIHHYNSIQLPVAVALIAYGHCGGCHADHIRHEERAEHNEPGAMESRE